MSKISQILSRFPQQDLTDRYMARYRRNFKAYKGQGTINIENHGVKSAQIYINGKYLPLKLSEEKCITVDIRKYTVDGTNTIKVINIEPKGSYLNVFIPYPVLNYGDAAKEGFSLKRLNLVDKLIESEINEGFPGASLIIIKNGKIIKESYYGYKKIWDGYKKVNNTEKINKNTIFDLASNTKMYAVCFEIMQLVDRGKINLNDKVNKYLPNFKDSANDKIKGKDEITLKHLLVHSAGFTPDPQYFNPSVAGDLYSQDRETTLKMLCKTPLIYKPGTDVKYSDVDFMLLGYICEKVTGQKQDDYVEKNIYKPLNLNHTVYNPLLKGFSKDDCAATERNGNTRDFSIHFPNIRTKVVQGQVQDEKAYYSMNGISGHAGLFSNVRDLSVLVQMILNGGGYGDYTLCSGDVLDQFMKPSDIDPNFSLGWNRKAYNSNLIWEFGPYASNLTIGHTGWTGTVTCIDPKYDMAVILLTNERNTPCLNGNFEGTEYQTGKYGTVISMIYEAFLNKNNDDIESGLTQLGTDAVNKLKSNFNDVNIKAAKAIVNILPEGLKKDELNEEIKSIKIK